MSEVTDRGSTQETTGQGRRIPWHQSSILEAPLHSLDAGLWGPSWQKEARQHLRMLRAVTGYQLVPRNFSVLASRTAISAHPSYTPAMCGVFSHIPAGKKKKKQPRLPKSIKLGITRYERGSRLRSTSYLASDLSLRSRFLCWNARNSLHLTKLASGCAE